MTLSKIIKTVKPLANRKTLIIILALLSAFGVVKPETATSLRNIVVMLPSGEGDLL